MGDPENKARGLSDKRSIPKTLGSFITACFWFLWDSFWKVFNLESVGDEMKEHSPNLNKKRAGVLIALAVVCYLGTYIESYRSGKQIDALNRDIHIRDDTIRELRQLYAGRPTTKPVSELMGLHDETNYFAVTNTIIRTNVKPNIIFSNNSYITYFNYPLLDSAQIERIKSKLRPVSQITMAIGYSDIGCRGLADQIARIFDDNRFNVKWTPIPSPGLIPVNGISLTSKKLPAGPINAAFIQLCSELHVPTRYVISTNMDDKLFMIYINTP